MQRIEVFADAEALAEHAAAVFLDLACLKLKSEESFHVALSGGSTPGLLYRKLANIPLDWKRIHVFWVDERCVPPDHPDSNYRMTAEALLNKVEIPTTNVHRIPGELPPELAAALYERELHEIFAGITPAFDLVLLGLGVDGHTASLFPGSPMLDETGRWVAPVRHDSPPPPLVDRITLTYPILQAGKRVVFLISGKEKSAILETIFTGRNEPGMIPAEKFLENISTSWLVDQEAANGISSHIESNQIKIHSHSSHIE